MTQDIELFNLEDGIQLVSPCIIVHGQVVKKNGASTIQIQHPQLPPLTYPINETHFKATIMLSPGENRFTFITNTNVSRVITCFYSPLTQNLPIHLCLLLAKDSPMVYDAPKTQIQRENGNGLDLAIKKLRVGARLMQAFTNEQMLRNGFGQRTFSFVEEYAWDTTFKQNVAMRNTVKIHILRSDKTTAEIRSHNVAQQNPKASDSGALFSWAIDAVKNTDWYKNSEHPVQAACMIMDAHWDGKFITGHAALGGGTADVKMAIFGSHGLYSWPTCIEDLIPYYQDETRTSLNEVANDNGECGTHWECLNITLGAFLHEIGHSLGSPHQVNGIMLRDYVTLNRSFMTKEAFSVRTNSYGAAPPIFPKEECTWNRLDLLRYIYKPSCTVPTDYYDPSFMKPHRLSNYGVSAPTVYPLGNNSARIVSKTGIYCLSVIYDDLERGHMEWLPKSLGGEGPIRELIVNLKQLQDLLPADQVAKHGNDFSVRIMAVNSDDQNISNFPELLKVKQISMDKYGLSKGVLGVKSPILGDPNRGEDIGIVPIRIKDVIAVRVYHGGALDGLRFYYGKDSGAQGGKAPSIPPRTYMSSVSDKMKNFSISDKSPSVLFGNQTNNYSDVNLEKGEIITGFNLRKGVWIDAIQILTSHGRITSMFGNATGGSGGELNPPQGQYILGLYGRVGQWVDAMGIVYGHSP
ncbi:hypothetical protein TBLA_0B05840 [Henningerozyma blattae CBS 6284]|uniref:Jacalin-type lectin domain-containing protein n=1 Tax=Henningerozyma blattae (strain ATCC 34711 / CBS 6284 / DSM 70876 / NBRC 10599 / NRRL Y-10934 / UCD 77-7) TaxID=1071380 RepID=I2GZ58_HENB6|nr:hypothetical protein TBLA_0B05840 [Tetrapisispora blattae CBS 6284]CCH59410.1 hypothetical protein TBLA_0B05840 [Tetrapisispora blattae CBS 6284]